MKAIVLAAGRGLRLGAHTRTRPKCLVTLGGASLLSYQLEALRTVAQEIVIVRGYRGEQIRADGVRFVENPDYASRNTVDSLMKARHELVGDCLVCYSDLVYERALVAAVAGASASVGVAIDVTFEDYWRARWGSTERDSESLTVADGRVRSIGAPNPEPADVDGRFIGLMRLDARGCESLKEVYDCHARRYVDRAEPWYHAPSFAAAAMTDMCQAMIDADIAVTAVPVQGGWIEVDTAADRCRYEGWINDGRMSQFCRALSDGSQKSA